MRGRPGSRRLPLPAPGASAPPTRISRDCLRCALRRQEGGLAGLYRGVYPTTVRAAILTASQLPVYDQTKHILLSHPATAGHAKVCTW